MATQDPRVDRYISQAPEYAKPVLAHLRQLIHAACPEVEETIKWRNPSFVFKGMLCGMAAFKQHLSFGFWRHDLIVERSGAQKEKAAAILERLGHVTRLDDLPADRVLLGFVRTAVQLNEAGVKRVSAKPKPPKAPLVVPEFLTAALESNARARATFDKFSYSHRKEYVEWLTEAKREETRAKRLETALTWLAEGKSRNWKYENC